MRWALLLAVRSVVGFGSLAATARGLTGAAGPARPLARGMAALGAVAVGMVAWPAEAQTPTALERARLLSASPDTPLFSFSHRGALRATLGGELPVLGARGRAPTTLQVVPLVELHNRPGSEVLLPNEQWRGRLGVELWRTRAGASRPWEVGLVAEHESDHDTARGDSDYRFLGINDVAVRALVLLPLDPVALAVNVDVRGLVWSCTRLATPCADFAGASTLGASAGLVADLRAGAARGWRPFLAADLSGFVARGSVAAERRIVAQAGWWMATDRRMWQVVAQGMAGNDVGMRRTVVVGQAGLGVRFSLSP